MACLAASLIFHPTMQGPAPHDSVPDSLTRSDLRPGEYHRPAMSLWMELLIAVALLLVAPLTIFFARYRLWRARFAAGRTSRGFLETEIHWRILFVFVGLLLAVAAFAAVMLSGSR